MTSKKTDITEFVLPIYLPAIVMSIGTGMVVLLFPLLSAELTGDYGTASFIFAMFGAGTLASDIPAGIAVSRLGARTAMTIGVIIFGMSAIIAGIFTTSLILGISGFLLGIGRGLVMLSRMTYIADRTTNQRGRAMATVGGTMRVGMLLGPILGGYIAEYLSYSLALVIAGTIISSTTIFVLFLKTDKDRSSSVRHHNPFKTVGYIVRQYKHVFLTAGLAVTGLQLLRAARLVIVPFWGKSIGLSTAEIGLITGISMGLELTMFYPVGIIMDRFGRKWTSVPCIAIFAFAFFLIPMSYDFVTLLLAVLVAGVGNGLGSGIFLTLGADFSPEEGRSDFLGVWRLIGDSGHTAGPFLVGTITGLVTLTYASFVMAAIGLTSAAIMLVLVKESKEGYTVPSHSPKNLLK